MWIAEKFYGGTGITRPCEGTVPSPDEMKMTSSKDQQIFASFFDLFLNKRISRDDQFRCTFKCIQVQRRMLKIPRLLPLFRNQLSTSLSEFDHEKMS